MPTLTEGFSNTDQALESLRKRWASILTLQALLLLAGTTVLLNWWTEGYAIRWLGLAALSSLVYLGILWRSLAFNSRPGEKILLPDLGPGNLLTILRGLFLALLMGFLLSPWPPGWLAWVPGLLYSIVAIADLFDGYLARKFDHQTLMGERLDLSLDGLGMLVASILLVQYGQVPAWYLLVGLARYLFVAGIWLRRMLDKPVFELGPNPTRRPFAGAQMGFAAVVLYPFFGPPGTALAAALFAVPFLVGFTVDWLEVCGVNFSGFFQRAKIENYDGQNKRLLKNIFVTWLPLVFRGSLVVIIGYWVFQNSIGQDIISGLSQVSFSTSFFPWLSGLVLIIGIGTLMIALGAAGRIAALIILFGVGIYVNNYGLDVTEALLVIVAAALLYLGTGPYSLWNPEQGIISRRLGEL
jgi:CDP-diacylglycerol--glycerol-3-phosphate 3-phosphatidyltransferase